MAPPFPGRPGRSRRPGNGGGNWASWYTATATDRLDQVSPPATAPAITIDTTSPTVTMQALPAFQNQTAWTLRWAGSDPDPGTGVRDYRLDHQFEGGAWQTLGYSIPLAEWPYTTAQEGTHHFRARALDRAYNAGGWAQTGTVVDLTAPGLSLALAAASGGFTVTAVATDTRSKLLSLAFPQATAAGDTYPLNGVQTATRSHPYLFDAGDTLSGMLTVTATDRAGNRTPQPFSVVRDAVAPTASVHVPAAAPLRFEVTWAGQDTFSHPLLNRHLLPQCFELVHLYGIMVPEFPSRNELESCKRCLRAF